MPKSAREQGARECPLQERTGGNNATHMTQQPPLDLQHEVVLARRLACGVGM